ncbi:hypothetical protein [Streptococcus salivarius]|uniref:hypothetical protein n=1 Tax=Streptococcus salivarius TaxID=1304 RepID=UPI0002251096|nr:hypothetical protein [Streptococcus salivarius]EGX30616.1 hypothetical protein SSALIVM18_08056 [Streptococcus salivarius M18]MBT0940672.1 hypothetical protein [Streptococcus salivarius]MBZ5845968.1 hypothetical protein [Streptococcus salivarius]MTQ30344.1 hypothetical protein [Streptococcus salivarius]MTQ37912.1 hypothetical protein [Streptococcus salivarius]
MQKNRKINFIIIGALILVISILLLILDTINFPTRFGFDIKSLNFEIWNIYATFLGSGLTLYGVLITISSQYESQIEDTKRIVKPMINVSSVGEYDYKNKYIQFDFTFPKVYPNLSRKNNVDTPNVTISIENIGTRELYNLYIGNFKATYFNDDGHYYQLDPILYSKHQIQLNLMFYEKIGYLKEFNQEDKFHLLISPIKFSTYFQDCLNNWYEQSFELRIYHQVQTNKSDEETSLTVSIERVSIDSAPKEISPDLLPWVTNPSKLVYYL